MLYWAPSAWCQLSIIDFQGGQYYTVEAGGGRPHETYLAQCDRSQPHRLRIELGRDCVRYLTRTASEAEWTTQRVVRRPLGCEGAPTLLILGKGYGSTDPQYGQPDLDNDYADHGPVIESWFEEVDVEPTAPDRLKLQLAELAPAGDVMGETILAEPGDPTYERVAAVYPPMRHMREAVGVKWHPDEVGVTETGALELGTAVVGGQPMPVTGVLTIGADQVPFGSGPDRPTKRLLDGHLPVVEAEWSHEGVTYEETVLGYSEGFSPDAPLFAYVKLEATTNGQAREVPVSFAVSPASLPVVTTSTVLKVSPGEKALWGLRIPCPLKAGALIEDICACEVDAYTLRTRRFWEAEYAGGMQIDVPDARLTDGYRAWLAYSAINVDKVDGFYEAHDGSGFYEAVFGYSAARYAWALDLYGHHDDAAALLACLRNRQTPDGLLDWNFGLTDTGAYLCALAVHYETTGDAGWLLEHAPSAVSACDWITRHRAESRDEGPLVAGLISHRSYCDYLPPVYGYLHNCYCCVGMERIAKALRAVGRTEDARRIGSEAAAYRRDILASMRAATITRDGRRIIPMEPDTQRLLKDSGYESRDYYGLVASTLLECGLPAPGSRDERLIEGFLRECGGIQMGVSEFVGGIDHAYGYGYLWNQLVAGRPERYLLGLYASLAYGMTRETFSSVECTQLKSGENALTLPHTYSNTQQLFMLRTMLVRDEGNTLILCSGVPRPWLANGKRIEVEGAETAFGTVSFEVRSRVNQGEVSVSLTPPTRQAPKAIVLHLRHPQAKRIAEVTVNGRRWNGYDAETVTLSDVDRPCRIVVTFGR
ncbi:MAG: hypothetical protein FJX75_00415 [Armatimonadetes bacterium]|nr:hypothetical protein [Armatimonadota bacterium]